MEHSEYAQLAARMHHRSGALRKALLLICGVAAFGSGARAQDPATVAPTIMERTLCRAANPDEDASLESRCSAVCKSTDGDCSDELYNLIKDGGTRVAVTSGTYPMRTPYAVRDVQNVSITGEGTTLFEFDNASIQFLNDRNVELHNFAQRGTSDGNAGYFRFSGTQDILIHKITFDSGSGNSRMFYISDGTRVTIRDSTFKADSTGLCLVDGSGRDWLVENNYWENGSNACLNAFGSLCGARFVNNSYIGSGTTPPYAAISLEEFADFCGSGVAFDNITIERNAFKGVNGVLTVDREKGYRFNNIIISNNEFNGRTAISVRDEANGLAIIKNTIRTDVPWHAVNLAPRTAEDRTMTGVIVSGNRIEHAGAGQVALNLSRIENATITGNDIASYADCALVNSTRGTTITGNRLSCGNRAFRFSNNAHISEHCNDVTSPSRYSAVGNNDFYFEMWQYSAIPAGCYAGGLMDGKTIILNAPGMPEKLTCLDGKWQAYDASRAQCSPPAGDPANR